MFNLHQKKKGCDVVVDDPFSFKYLKGKKFRRKKLMVINDPRQRCFCKVTPTATSKPRF